MPETHITAIQAIQAILAPAVGISAVGLLLIGLNNRYTAIINRIRLLNNEKRNFSRLFSEKGDLDYPDNIRFMNVKTQTQELLLRSKYVRNGILSLQNAVALFVLTSVLIALNLFVNISIIKTLPLIIFIIGMISVFVGMIFWGIEVYRSYKIVLLEVIGDE